MPERGIDQLAGADLSGAVVLILLRGAAGRRLPLARRAGRGRSTEAGAAAVIAIVGDEVPWAVVTRQLRERHDPAASRRRCRASAAIMPAARRSG